MRFSSHRSPVLLSSMAVLWCTPGLLTPGHSCMTQSPRDIACLLTYASHASTSVALPDSRFMIPGLRTPPPPKKKTTQNTKHKNTKTKKNTKKRPGCPTPPDLLNIEWGLVWLVCRSNSLCLSAVYPLFGVRFAVYAFRYRRGQGIAPHQDGPLYRPMVAILSLAGPGMLQVGRCDRVPCGVTVRGGRVLQPCGVAVRCGRALWPCDTVRHKLHKLL